MNFYLFTSEFYSSKHQTIVVKNSRTYDKTNKLSKLMFISKRKEKKKDRRRELSGRLISSGEVLVATSKCEGSFES